MSTLLLYATGLVLWCLWTVPLTFSDPGQNLNAPSSPPSFEADLLRIDGDRYVVKDNAGVERQVHVGRNTEIVGPFGKASPGDRMQ